VLIWVVDSRRLDPLVSSHTDFPLAEIGIRYFRFWVLLPRETPRRTVAYATGSFRQVVFQTREVVVVNFWDIAGE